MRGGGERGAVPFVLIAAVTLLATACVRVHVQRGGGSAASAVSAARDSAAFREVRELLEHGARAWNAGDLDGFVSDYAADATFVTATRVVRGRAAIRQLYSRRFEPGATRDSLHFEQLEVDVLGQDELNAIAYYVLQRGDSVTARGPTSLVMRRMSGRWYIVHDHSS